MSACNGHIGKTFSIPRNQLFYQNLFSKPHQVWLVANNSENIDHFQIGLWHSWPSSYAPPYYQLTCVRIFSLTFRKQWNESKGVWNIHKQIELKKWKQTKTNHLTFPNHPNSLRKRQITFREHPQRVTPETCDLKYIRHQSNEKTWHDMTNKK